MTIDDYSKHASRALLGRKHIRNISLSKVYHETTASRTLRRLAIKSDFIVLGLWGVRKINGMLPARKGR